MGIIVYSLRTVENTFDFLHNNVVTVLVLVGTGAGIYFVVLVILSAQFRTTVRENFPILEPYLFW